MAHRARVNDQGERGLAKISGDTLTGKERKALAQLFALGLDFLDHKRALDAGELESLLAVPSGGIATASLTAAVTSPFFETVRAMISYFVVARGPSKFNEIEAFTKAVCEVFQARFGERLAGVPVRMALISNLQQSYWDARARRTPSREVGSSRSRIIRVNDIPFAEAVFPALISRRVDRPFVVEIVDVDWKDVGASLMNGLIDVAIYPEYIVEQIADVKNSSKKGAVYKSNAALMTYNKYPVVRNNGSVSKQGVLAYPVHSDFETVIAAVKGVDQVSLSGGKTTSINVSSIVPCKSADSVLAQVVDGEVEYGLVGGLQAHYGTESYGRCYRTSAGLAVEDIGYLDPPQKNPCHLWTASALKEDADVVVDGVIDLWNEFVVKGWKELVDSTAYPSTDTINRQNNLVAMVNAQSHCSFISGFAELQSLISSHDTGVTSRVAHGCDVVSIP